MDTVVTPLYKRPEYFKLWTEILQTVDGAGDQFYIFCLDYGYDTVHDHLLKSFPYDYGIIKTPRTQYRLTKQSYNVLNGMMAGAKHSTGLVYYIEEDIFLAKDFFRFHREVHRQQPDIFCSIGTKNNNTSYDVTDDENSYYLSTNGDYQSLGSCFKKEVINEMIGRHFREEYFKDPVKHCTKHFPASSIGKFFVEQDGLIRRILEQSGKATAFPHVPRGFHGGMYGYNRRDDQVKKMSIEQRVEKIKRVAFDKEALKKYVQHAEYYADSEPCRLDTDFNTLTNVNVNTKINQ